MKKLQFSSNFLKISKSSKLSKFSNDKLAEDLPKPFDQIDFFKDVAHE